MFPDGLDFILLASIHLHGNARIRFDAFLMQMLARLHHREHASKLLEIDAFLRFQRMLDEEWNDAFAEDASASHAIAHSVAVILANDATLEVILERVEDLHITFVLHDGEFRKDLKAGPHFANSD